MGWLDEKCAAGRPRLDGEAVRERLADLQDWSVREERLHRRFGFRDFLGAMRFVNAMADLAEREGHHPDFCVHYAAVEVTLWTHSVGGLSENDFILAAKIDALPREAAAPARG